MTKLELGELTLQASDRLSDRPCLEWTVRVGGGGREKSSLLHHHPSPYFWQSTAPLVQIYFSPLPSAAIKIKDGGHNFRYEITEHSLAKITPALQAIARVVTKIHSSSHGNQVDNQTWFDATLVWRFNECNREFTIIDLMFRHSCLVP